MKAQITQIFLGLVLVLSYADVTEARADGIEGVAGIIGVFTPISLFVVGMLLYFILKKRYQKEIYIAAIEKGMSVPEMDRKTPTDLRKPALILIALGLGFSIATFVTISYVSDPDAVSPLQISIWGIVPILIGVALLVYRRIAEQEQAENR